MANPNGSRSLRSESLHASASVCRISRDALQKGVRGWAGGRCGNIKEWFGDGKRPALRLRCGFANKP